MYRYSMILLSTAVLFLSGCGESDKNSTQQMQKSTIKQTTISQLAIKSINTPPIAKTQKLTTDEDTPYSGELKAKDKDSDEISFVLVDAPRHGTVTLNKNGCFTYTPDKGYKGEDSFSFRAKDDISVSDTKVVTISVKKSTLQPPKPIRSLKAKEISSSKVTLLWEDNEESKTAYLLYVDGKLHCEISKDKKEITLTNLKANTKYTFTLKRRNQAGESKGKDIVITTKDVTSKPNAPTDLKILAQDDNSIRLGWKDNADNESSYEIYKNGQLLKTISTNCRCTIIQNIKKDETITFEVRAKNRLGSSSGAILTLNPKEEPTTPTDNNTTKPSPDKNTTIPTPNTNTTVTPKNNTTIPSTQTNTTKPLPETNTTTPSPEHNTTKQSPETNTTKPPKETNTAPQAQKQTITLDEDRSKDIILTATDKEKDRLSFQITSQPKYGRLTGTPPHLTYTPNKNYNGNDSFSFKAYDGKLSSEIQTVSIKINSINDKPTVDAGSDIQSTEQLPITLNATASDIDDKIQSYRWSEANTTLATTASFTKDDFSVGEHNITLTVTDDEGATASDRVTIKIEAKKKKPDVKDDSNSTTDTNNTNTEHNTTTPNTPTLTSITLKSNTTTLNIGEKAKLNITATYQDNTTKPINKGVTYIITPKDHAKINKGELTALKDGNLTIQAKVGNTLSNKLTLNIYWEVDGYRLPPEPDPKINNATLLGIDSNHNGVRDDVERWIYKHYNHPIERGIMLQNSYRLQKQISDISKSHYYVKLTNKSLSCEYYLEDTFKWFKDKYEYSITSKEIKKIQFNTLQRHIAYQKYNASFNGEVFSEKIVPNIDNCQFDNNGNLRGKQ